MENMLKILFIKGKLFKTLTRFLEIEVGLFVTLGISFFFLDVPQIPGITFQFSREFFKNFRRPFSAPNKLPFSPTDAVIAADFPDLLLLFIMLFIIISQRASDFITFS